MSKRAKGKLRDARPSRRWRHALAGIIIAAGLVAGGWWWLQGPSDVPSGPPRLVVDRAEIDLGRLRFDTPTRATFTLSNGGGEPLEIAQSPRVKAVVGC